MDEHTWRTKWSAQHFMSRNSRSHQALNAIDFLANNGEIAGGEVMLLRMAQAAADHGISVRVVGPETPSMLREASCDLGLTYVSIPGRDRRRYLFNLARWSMGRRASLLWCNGLLPAFASSLSANQRVVHLHQMPRGLQRVALRLARWRHQATVVPSRFMATQVPGALPLQNWTEDFPQLPGPARRVDPVRVGYIGRLALIKGIHVLADAMKQLEISDGEKFTLTIAGEGRFVPGAVVADLRRQLANLHHVEELGWVPREQFYEAIDIVVVPSVWDEPFGLVAAEAMAFGVPVIVSDAGALPEVVGEDHPWVVRRGDPTDLASTIQKVSRVPSNDLNEQMRRARIRWNECFSQNVGEERFLALLRDMRIDIPEAPNVPVSVTSKSA